MTDITLHSFYDPSMPLTADTLMNMPDGIVFAKGELPDSPDGINMTGSGKMLRWIAKRGNGYHDWCIYCYWAKTQFAIGPGLILPEFKQDETNWDYIKVHGDKVKDERNIRQCINVDDDAMKLYRY